MADSPGQDEPPPLGVLRSAGVVFLLEDPETQIGRGSDNDIVRVRLHC